MSLEGTLEIAVLGLVACAVVGCGGGAGAPTGLGGPAADGGPVADGGQGSLEKTLSVVRSGSGTVRSEPAGIECGSACSVSFSAGTTVTLVAAAAPDSTFAGWTGACSGSGACSLVLAADTTVSAMFKATAPNPAPRHTLAVTRSGAGRGQVISNPGGIDCGVSCSAAFAAGTQAVLTATASPGSRFSGWTGACQGIGNCALALDRDLAVQAAFEPAPAPDECAGLAAPADPGASRASAAESGGNYCLRAEGDGSGSLALPIADGKVYRVRLVNSLGAQIGTFGDIAPFDLFGKRDGFEGLLHEHTTESGSVVVLSADGTVRNRSAPLAPPTDADDPTGGLMVFSSSSAFVGYPYPPGPARLLSYDASGNVRWEHRFSEDTVDASGNSRSSIALGVDRGGNTLLLYQLGGPSSPVFAQWFDAAGKPSAPFPLAVPAASLSRNFTSDPSSSSVSTAFSPRVEGGLFLQRTVWQCAAGTCSPHVEWYAQFLPFANAMESAPEWLRNRPQTDLHLVRGGRGYAVLPSTLGIRNCLPPVEIVTASGKSCSKTSFAGVPDRCDTTALGIGVDGTLVRSSTSGDQTGSMTQPASCTWRWWPAFFK